MAVQTHTSQEMKPIHAAIGRWRLRLRFQQALIWLPRGLAIGLALAFLLAVSARLWPLVTRDVLIRLCILLAALGTLSAGLAVFTWRRTPLALAREFDLLFGFRERLSAALEIAQGELPIESAALVSAQRADAVSVLADADPRQVMPMRLDWRDWALAGIGLGLLVLAIVMPNPQEDILAQQAEVRQVIAEQIQTLEELRQEALEDPALTDSERVMVVESLDEAIETLSQEGITQEEAVAAMDAAEQHLRDLSELSAEEQAEALQSASAMFPGDVADALAEGDFAGAAEALDQPLEEMTQEELEALADQLEQAADALEGVNPDLAGSLREAAEALRDGDLARAQEAMSEAAEEMAFAGEGAETPVESYADELGEGQQAMAGAGQAAESQPGVMEGEGQQGDSPGGTSAGRGESEGQAPGQLSGDDVGTNDPGDGGLTEYDDIYAPQRIGGEGGERVDLPTDPETGMPVQEGEFTDNPTGEASVPYSQVWADYEGSVNEALESGYVPLGMRGLIQYYFSRLDPGE